MPASKAQQKAVNKYMAANYDRVNLTMPKGRKDVIQAHAAAQGESVNGFINRSIDSQMGRDASSGPTEAHTALSEAGRPQRPAGRRCRYSLVGRLKLRPRGIN